MTILGRRAGIVRAAAAAGHSWSFDARVSGPSGLSIPVPTGFRVGFWDDFTAYSNATDLEAATYGGQPVYSAYSGQDGAYSSGYWAKSHLTFSSGQLVLNGYFDPGAHATKYVTAGFSTYWLAYHGNVPAGSMWVWCAREDAAGGAPIKGVGMTYGSTWPAAGTYVKRGTACANVGNSTAEWPYCGEDDHRESDQGSGSSTTTLHWHAPYDVTCSLPGGTPTGNLNGHHQQQLGSLTLDHSAWHIYGMRTDPGGIYRGFTNDNGTSDAPLREWLTVTLPEPTPFRQAGRRFIYQQEAWQQPDGATGTKRIYVDWIACLIPV